MLRLLSALPVPAHKAVIFAAVWLARFGVDPRVIVDDLYRVPVKGERPDVLGSFIRKIAVGRKIAAAPARREIEAAVPDIIEEKKAVKRLVAQLFDFSAL